MSSKFSTSSPRPDLPQTVVIGRVRRAHGVRGEVLVEVLSDIPHRFRAGADIQVADRFGKRRTMTIDSASGATRLLRLKFRGVEDRDAAAVLRGARLEVARDEVPAAPEGSYYFFELVGCSCADEKVGRLGRVTDVIEDGGGLLLQIESPRGELLVPFVRSYLRRVDIADRRIELSLPEGLVETCVSKS